MGSPGLPEWGPGGARRSALGRPPSPPRAPSWPPRRPAPSAPPRPRLLLPHTAASLLVLGAQTFPTPPASRPRPRPSSLAPHLCLDRPSPALAGLPALRVPPLAPRPAPRPSPLASHPQRAPPLANCPALGPSTQPPGLPAPESSAPGSLSRPRPIDPAFWPPIPRELRPWLTSPPSAPHPAPRSRPMPLCRVLWPPFLKATSLSARPRLRPFVPLPGLRSHPASQSLGAVSPHPSLMRLASSSPTH